MEKKSIGIEIKNIDNMIIRKIFAESKHHNNICLSPVQIGIIKYMIKHKNEKIYQKDIEKELYLRRSTVSGILQTMEKNELIKRIDSNKDARSKEIIVTDKTINMANKMKNKFLEFEQLLCENIKEEDLEIFFKVTNQIKENLTKER